MKKLLVIVYKPGYIYGVTIIGLVKNTDKIRI